jgi:hypothetical protein
MKEDTLRDIKFMEIKPSKTTFDRFLVAAQKNNDPSYKEQKRSIKGPDAKNLR